MEITQFSSILDISDHQEDFANISLQELEDKILKNENFKTDSEDSIFSALMFWIKKQKQKQYQDNFMSASSEQKTIFVDTYLRPTFRYINFSKMSRYYLANVIPHYLEEYDPKIYIDIINRVGDENPIIRSSLMTSDSNFELEFQRRQDWEKEQPYLDKKITTSVIEDTARNFGVKVQFNNLSEWQEEENEESKKYYSQKVEAHGYNFYVFLKKVGNGVGAFVRCTGGTENPDHLLPAKMTFTVISSVDSKKIRSIDPITANFNHFDRSLGVHLTQEENETWDNFIKGNTSLTEKYSAEGKLDNRITILMELQLLNESTSASQKEFPNQLNLGILNQNPKTKSASQYVEAIIKRNLLLANRADSLFQMLTYWIKAEENKFFASKTFESANKTEQIEFIENYLKPIIYFVPFNKMTPEFFDNQVNNFFAQYSIGDLYGEEKTRYDRERPMSWPDIRIAWAQWRQIVASFEYWQKHKDIFIKENPHSTFNVSRPYVPNITNIIATLDELPTDSEESILFLALDYAHESSKKGWDFIGTPSHEEWKNLWERIQWNAISENYFFFIRDYIEKINNPALNEIYTVEKQRRQNGGKISLTLRRSQIKDPNKVMIKCIFQNVRAWIETDKHYSSPVLINGYKFYYFLQRELISKPGEPPVFGLAGFLRAHLGDKKDLAEQPALQEKEDINLPVNYSVTILTDPKEDRMKERKFSPLKICFTHTCRAIGGKLSIANETWDTIIKGASPIVKDNTISVILSIDFNTDVASSTNW